MRAETKSRDAVDAHFKHRGAGDEFAMEVDYIRLFLPGIGSRVLDIGCGIGALVTAIRPLHYVGIDFLLDGLRLTHGRHLTAPVACADAMATPFLEDTFDAVVMQHVIEHLPNFARGCAEWMRILKPGGRLILITPNNDFTDLSIFDDPTHVGLFDARRLVSEVRRCGLHVLDVRTLGLDWFRQSRNVRGVWRLRQFVLRHSHGLATVPTLRWKGQSLCCVAAKPLETLRH